MATRPTSRHAKRHHAAIPFPDIPSEGMETPLFWRAMWLRAEAQLAAVRQHMDLVWNQRTTTEPLRFALAGLWYSLRSEAAQNFDHLVKHGGLLYAWLPESGAA